MMRSWQTAKRRAYKKALLIGVAAVEIFVKTRRSTQKGVLIKRRFLLVCLGFKIVMNLRHSRRREAGLYLVYCPVSRLRRMARRRAILEANDY